MFRKMLLILILIHIVGDFYSQPDKLSREKEKSYKYVLIHSLIYSITCFLLIIIINDEWIKYVAIAASLQHFIVDTLKYFYIKKYKCNNDFKKIDGIIYAIDQAIHITIFIIIALIVVQEYSSITKRAIIDKIFILAELSSYQVLKWITLILFIGKPSNITIKKLLQFYRPSANDLPLNNQYKEKSLIIVESKNSNNCKSQVAITGDDKKAGGYIGFLERFIIVIFLAINQYSAIGLILTAKSIARYDRITNDQVFAEYYLLGTLLSTLLAIITYFMIFQY